MMAIVLISELNRLLAHRAQFYVDVVDKENLDRLKKSTGLDEIFISEEYVDPHWHRYSKFKKFFKLPHKIMSTKRAFDKAPSRYVAQIALGGDDFSEYYSIRGLAQKLIKVFYSSKKIPLFLAGQTIGPFYKFPPIIAKYLLSRCHIYTRDPNCYQYLTEVLKFENVKESRDLAFLNLPNQENQIHHIRLLRQYKLDKDQYVTLIPSGLSRCYTDDRTAYVGSWVKVIKRLLSQSESSNKIVLLAHVLRPAADDDRAVINEITHYLSVDEKERVVEITGELLPYEARIIIGNGIYTISGRMHGAVSSFQMGKPAVSLSYGAKYAGVIGKGLNMERLIIESTISGWNNGTISKEVLNKIEYIIKNYHELKEQIAYQIKASQKMAINQINDIVNRIAEVSND